MSILGAIYQHDAKRPAALAGSMEITYGRLCSDIDAMARWLLAQGLEPGDRVTLHVRNLPSPDYWDWIMHLGAIRAGLVHSTNGMPPAIARTGALGPYKAAVGLIGNLAPVANPELRLAFAPESTEPLEKQLDSGKKQRKLDGLEAQAVRLLSTSGTTGTPKVLAWDAKLIADRLGQVREIGGIDADTALLTCLGLPTTTGLRYPIAGWQLGALVILSGIGSDLTDLKQAAQRSTFLAASPFRMQQLLPQVPGQWADKDKRTIELFGGRVPPGLRDTVLARCCDRLLMSYGSTEVGRVAAGETTLVDLHPGAVGMVEPGITVEIVDRQGNAVAAGTPGIVRMKSPFMCGTYIGSQASGEPVAVLRDGWFYPGDFGVLREDGLFAIVGRLSETLNVSGAKINPVTIEEKIAQHPEVSDVVVMSLPLKHGDALTVGVVCDAKVDLKQLSKDIAPHLPRNLSFTLISLPNIPRNAMGRIRRQVLTQSITAQVNNRIAKRAQREQENTVNGAGA